MSEEPISEGGDLNNFSQGNDEFISEYIPTEDNFGSP